MLAHVCTLQAQLSRASVASHSQLSRASVASIDFGGSRDADEMVQLHAPPAGLYLRALLLHACIWAGQLDQLHSPQLDQLHSPQLDLLHSPQLDLLHSPQLDLLCLYSLCLRLFVPLLLLFMLQCL